MSEPGNRWGTLIVRASEHAPAASIELLIRLGASVDVWDDPKTAIDTAIGYTPLHAAAWHGNRDAAAVLLKHGAKASVREAKYCATPAGWADYSGHAEVRDLILDGPIDIFDAIVMDWPHRIPGVLALDPGALERPFGTYVIRPPNPSQSWVPDRSWTPRCSRSSRTRPTPCASCSSRAPIRR